MIKTKWFLITFLLPVYLSLAIANDASFLLEEDGNIKQRVSGKVLPLMKIDVLEMDRPDKIVLAEVIIEKKPELAKLNKDKEQIIDTFTHYLPNDAFINSSDFFSLRDISTTFSIINKYNISSTAKVCSDTGEVLSFRENSSVISVEGEKADMAELTVGMCSGSRPAENIGKGYLGFVYNIIVPTAFADFLDVEVAEQTLATKVGLNSLKKSQCNISTMIALDAAHKNMATGKVTKEVLAPFIKEVEKNIAIIEDGGNTSVAIKMKKDIKILKIAAKDGVGYTREDHPKYLTKEEVAVLNTKKSMIEQAIKMEDHSFKERVVTIDRDGKVKHIEREIVVDYSGQDYSPHLTPEFLSRRFKQEAVAAGVKLSDNNSDSLAQTAMQAKIPLNIKSIVANSFKNSREVNSVKRKYIKKDSKKVSKSEWIANRSKFIDKQIERLERAYTDSRPATKKEELTKHIRSLKTKLGELDGELNKSRTGYKQVDRGQEQNLIDNTSSKSLSSIPNIKKDSMHVNDSGALDHSRDRGLKRRSGRALASLAGSKSQDKREDPSPETSGVLESLDRKNIIKKIMEVAVDFDPDVQRVVNRERVDMINGLQVDKSLFLDDNSSGKNRIFSAFLIQLIDKDLVENFFIVDGVKKLKMIFYFNEDGSFGYRPEKIDTIFREIRDSSYIKILKDIK